MDYTMTDVFELDAKFATRNAWRHRSRAEPATEYPVVARRHVLVFGENDDIGIWHIDGTRENDSDECWMLQHALEAFKDHVAYTLDEWIVFENTPARHGRYWCSVSNEGLFEIGGSVD